MAETVQIRGYTTNNESILELARQDGTGRPIEAVVRNLARDKLAEAEKLLQAIDEDWAPPPYDPFLVAQALGIRCIPVDKPELEDAMIFVQEGTSTILFRPERTRVRTRFNIFHEIAHTLFPDYQSNSLYRRARRPRLFEPEGQLEYLCDVAAAEFLMPIDLFCRDLDQRGFGAAQVAALCRRYEASMEAVCLRMVEANVRSCALALFEYKSPPKKRRRKDLDLLPDVQVTPQRSVRVSYAVPSKRFKERGFSVPSHLPLGSRSCIHRASRSKKAAQGEERLDLGRGCTEAFLVEALPMNARRRRHGRTPVLAFFYPL